MSTKLCKQNSRIHFWNFQNKNLKYWEKFQRYKLKISSIKMHSSMVKTSQISRHLKLCTTKLCRINECYIGWLMFVLSFNYSRKNILNTLHFSKFSRRSLTSGDHLISLNHFLPDIFLLNLDWNFYLYANKYWT